MMTSARWFRSEFASHPLVAIGEADHSQLTLIDRVAILHIASALENKYEKVLEIPPLDLFVSAELRPSAKVLASMYSGRGVVVISHGLIRATAALAARVATLWGNSIDRRSNPFFLIERVPFEGVIDLISFSVLKGFSLQRDVSTYCGFDEGSLRDLAAHLNGDTLVLTIEMMCAALEFIVLHESAHLALRHNEARELLTRQQTVASGADGGGASGLGQYRPEPFSTSRNRIERCLEHQADHLALKLMFFSAPRRPLLLLNGEEWTAHTVVNRTARKLLSFVGAALAFAVIALNEARDAEAVKGISFRSRASGEHPLPSIRLSVATHLLGGELSRAWRRLYLWPKALLGWKVRERQLHALGFCATITCMTAVQSNWQTMLDHSLDQSPEYLMRIVGHLAREDEVLGPMFTTDYLRAVRLVRSVRAGS